MMFPTNESRLAVRERPQAQSAVMAQEWRELLFLHWKVDPRFIQQTLPPGLSIDLHEGNAYLGVVPFLMRNVRPRFLPAFSGISDFCELNVRTYVYDHLGRPGVWFYSLDASQWLAVKIARFFFRLPYHHAQMRSLMQEGRIIYESVRKSSFEKTAFSYVVGEKTAPPQIGSLEFFLLERYLLFAYNESDGSLWSGRVHHTPYPVYGVQSCSAQSALIHHPVFFGLSPQWDHQVYSPGVDVRVYPLQKID